MIQIKSQPYPPELRGADEIRGMIEDLDGYKDQTLAEFRRFALWHVMLSRLTARECKFFVGHADYVLKQRKKYKEEFKDDRT